MDKFTPEQRSKVMRAIKGRDTLPEIVVRKWLFAHRWRFRCQYKKVPGHPDIALPRLKTLIEVRGCFWHRHGWAVEDGGWVQKGECPEATMPKTNVDFWNAKFLANVARDHRHEAEWAAAGWNVIVIWECELKTVAARERTFRALEQALTVREGALRCEATRASPLPSGGAQE